MHNSANRWLNMRGSVIYSRIRNSIKKNKFLILNCGGNINNQKIE